MFKRASRLLGRVVFGERRMFCACCWERGWRIVRVLDAVLRWYDGPNHCRRMCREERAWGVSDGLDRTGL